MTVAAANVDYQQYPVPQQRNVVNKRLRISLRPNDDTSLEISNSSQFPTAPNLP